MMNDDTPYDKLVQEILRQTRAGEIRWRATERSEFAPDVLHGNWIYKSFATDNYARGDEPYKLGYIEAKDAYTDEDGIETPHPELLIYKEGKLILSIGVYHVDAALLARLGSLISDQNVAAKSFLATF